MHEDTINVFGLLFVYLTPTDILSLRFICKTFYQSFKVQFRDTLEALGETRLLASFYRKKRLHNYDALLLEEAAKRGYMRLSRSLLRNGVKCSRIVVRNCCIGGNVDLIQYVHNAHSVTFQETDLEAASLSGHLDTVILLHEKYDIPCTPHALAVAIINKHLDIAVYLHTKGNCRLQNPNPISWPCFVACRDAALTELAISLSPDCPMWMVDQALTQGCDLRRILGKGKVPSPTRVRELCKAADLEVVRLLCENGAVLDEWSVTYICKSGVMPSIEYVFDYGAKPVTDVADYAAGWGELEVLQFLHRKGYVSTVHGMTVAAEAGALHIVKYLHSINIPILPRAIDGAIMYGHRDVAIFFYEKGGVCSSGLIRYATTQGRADIFELLHEVKQPLPQQSMKAARKYRRQEMFSTSPPRSPLSPPSSPPSSPLSSSPPMLSSSPPLSLFAPPPLFAPPILPRRRQDKISPPPSAFLSSSPPSPPLLTPTPFFTSPSALFTPAPPPPPLVKVPGDEEEGRCSIM